MLAPEDLAFVERRRRALRSWPWIGGASLALLTALAVWLFVRTPNLVVPGRAVNEALSGRLEQSTLMVIAALLPTSMLALLAVAGAAIGLVFAARANELRLLKLLDQAQAGEPKARAETERQADQ